MKTPIVVAYPRTGSEIVTEYVWNWAQQQGLARRCLREFLLVSWFRDDDFRLEAGQIQGDYWEIPRDQWQGAVGDFYASQQYHLRTQARLAMLALDPQNVFKLICNPRIPRNVYQWCLDNYHCVFVLRRDRVQSFLSFQLLPQIGLHHRPGTVLDLQPGTVKFQPLLADIWVRALEIFETCRRNAPDQSTVYYEDVLEGGTVSEARVLDALGWTRPLGYQWYVPQTVPTPYTGPDLWSYFTDPQQIKTYMLQWPQIFTTL